MDLNTLCCWPVGARLGEGPLWLAARQCLLFVDIKGRRLHQFRPGDGTRQSWDFPEMICWVLPCQHAPGLIAGFQSGIAYLEWKPDQTLHLSWLHRMHEAGSYMRLNDAKADQYGHIWFGTMDNEEVRSDAGSLYRLDLQGQITCVDSGYHVTNGPAFSRDGRTMYHTDSARRTVYAFDLDEQGWPKSGSRRVWLRFDVGQGYPDGMTVDAEDSVWIAHWDGACISRWSNQAQWLETVALEVSRPTSIAFGGADLRSMWITSASVVGDMHPGQGGLWQRQAAAPGLLPCSFGASAAWLAAHRPPAHPT